MFSALITFKINHPVKMMQISEDIFYHGQVNFNDQIDGIGRIYVRDGANSMLYEGGDLHLDQGLITGKLRSIYGGNNLIKYFRGNLV
jgi:hypothetical protein